MSASSGLTPALKSLRSKDQGSPDGSNKENIDPKDPKLRRSIRNKPAAKALFCERDEESRSKSPQKNKTSPRKRGASAHGDKARNSATPTKRNPPRNASAVAAEKTSYYYATDIPSPQVKPSTRPARLVLEVDNVAKTPSTLKPKTPAPHLSSKQRKAWRGTDSDDEDLFDSPPQQRLTRQGSVARKQKESEISPSKLNMDVLSLGTPPKRSDRTSQSPARVKRATNQTPSRSTVHPVVEESSRVTRRTPSRTIVAPTEAKKMSYTPIADVKLKFNLKKVGDKEWNVRTGKTPKEEGKPTPRVTRVQQRDKSYEPKKLEIEEDSEDDDDDDATSSESEEEEEEDEEEAGVTRRRRQRGGRGRGGKAVVAVTAAARSSSRARGGAGTATAAAKTNKQKQQGGYRLEVDDDIPMDTTSAPSNLAAALERLAVYRCPRGTLLCREQECKQIREFVEAAISANGSSQACYISGVPGTGKTASVMAMVRDIASSRSRRPPFVFIQVNAMYYTDPKQVFSEVLHEYEKQTKGEGGNVRRISGNAARKRLNALFETVDRSRPPVLMLIDELDQLSTKKQELIYDVFNWSSVEAARVSIISIANTLDLPERMLNQRICSRLGMNRIIFQPYTHEEIVQIVRSKLGGGEGEEGVIDETAIEIAARKVAKVSGDLRKAMDILRAAIKTAIAKGEKTITMQHVNESVRVASESLLVLAVRSLAIHQMILFEAAVDIIHKRDVADFSMCELVEKYELISRMSYEDEPLNYYAVVRILLQLSSLGLIKIINPNEKAIFRRRMRLLPAVHEALSAIKIVDQRDKERREKAKGY